MTPNRNSCEVYVESIAERRNVPYSALIPFSKSWQPQNRNARSGVRKYVRYHGEMTRGYYSGRPWKCILPSLSSMVSQYESVGYKNTIKRKIRNYSSANSKGEKSYNDYFQCNINFELSSSKSIGVSKKCDDPFNLRDLTSLRNFKPRPSQVTAAPLLVQNNSNPPVRHHNNDNRLVPNHNKNTNSKHNQQKNSSAGESAGETKPTVDIKTQQGAQKVDNDYKPDPETRNYFSVQEFTPNTFDGAIKQNQHHPGMDMVYTGQRFERNRNFYGSQNTHHPNENSGSLRLSLPIICSL